MTFSALRVGSTLATSVQTESGASIELSAGVGDINQGGPLQKSFEAAPSRSWVLIEGVEVFTNLI